MKKMLLGFIIDGKSGGVDAYLMSVMNAISSDIRIDCLTNKIDNDLKEELSKKNVRLYEVERLTHPLKQFRQISKLIKDNHYDVTYANVSTAISLSFSLASWKCKVPVRIVHSHSSGIDSKDSLKKKILTVIHYIGRWIFAKTSNRFFACSRLAGNWMFGSKIVATSDDFKVIPNTIDFEKFRYNPAMRAQIREQYNIQDKLVIGHVSNFQPVKNIEFLIEVFAKTAEEIENAVLFLIGNAGKHSLILEEIKKYGLQDKVILLDFQAEISKYYQAMDFFLLPSLFEGFPLVGIEAQVSGLHCLFSDKITREVQITEECDFLSIENGASVWSKNIKQHLDYRRSENMVSDDAQIYDSKNQREQLMNNLK